MPAARTNMTNRFDGDTVARLSTMTREPSWLAERRAEAFARFSALPWPDQSLEEWRHTDVRGLDIERFDPVPPIDRAPDPVEIPSESAALAQQADGGDVLAELSPGLAERGVIFTSLARAAESHPDLVQDWLGRAGASDHDAKFEALAAAFWSGAVFLYVPRGVEIALPVRVLRTITERGRAVFPRTIIVADEAASVTYIEACRSRPLDGEALSVGSVEIYAGQAAQVSYLSLQDWSQDVRHFNVTRSVIGRDATVRTLTATLGGLFSRTVVEALLEGQGAHAEMLGVYFGDKDQHIDHRTLQAHRAPDTSSELYFKGALKGRSRAIYSGLVDIEKDAQRADAQQSNRNLLLSEGASADPSPFLEIKTSEVTRATHGVSVGRPDEQVLFYLLARGLDPATAERLLVKGFFQEIIDRIRVESVRGVLERAVEAELALED